MSTTQQVAGAAGTALLVSIFSVVSATSGLVAGMSAAFMTATVIALAAVVLSADDAQDGRCGRGRRSRHPLTPAPTSSQLLSFRPVKTTTTAS